MQWKAEPEGGWLEAEAVGLVGGDVGGAVSEGVVS